jgi:heme/copper-type cytochrome/quinol oxidase subunit 3
MTAGSLTMPRRATPLPPTQRVPLIPNSVVAIVVIVTAEAMLFAGLIGAFLVFRLSARTWPPGDLPRLPIAVTLVNTAVLLSSLVPLTRALRGVRHGRTEGLPRAVAMATALGAVFLAVQGVEWVRLVHHGVTLQTSIYGATFYLLIGTHAAHVLCAVVWLVVLTWMAQRGMITRERYAGLEMGTVYWYFVCGLWVALFGLVYVY